MSHTKRGKIYYSMQAISLLPILLFGILILVFGSISFSKAMTKEVFDHLDTSAHLFITQIDSSYPGDYSLKTFTAGDQTSYALYKGDVNITSKHDMVDTFKADTGMEVTVFYQDTRILTTLLGWNNRRIIGTGAPEGIMQEVQVANQVQYYDNAMISGKKYYACYHPLTNSDGTVVGMIFVGKPVETVRALLRSSLNPIIALGLISMIIASMISFSYAKYFVVALHKLKTFFQKTATGNLNVKMDPSILKRDDEFTEIANAAVAMQKSLRNIVEQDSLTTLFNRRTGEQRLQSTYLSALDTNEPFCIVIADIDNFKKVNDTYGHHNGDIILQNVSNLLKKHTAQKGYAIRWGGEEFLLVFKNHSVKETVSCLQELQKELRSTAHAIENIEIYVTMTFGVACDSKLTISELIEAADDKLYEGKTSGRDCIVY